MSDPCMNNSAEIPSGNLAKDENTHPSSGNQLPARDRLMAFYRARKDRFAQDLEAIKKNIDGISNLRIALAVAILGCLIGGTNYPPLLYLVFPLILIFAFLMARHARLFQQKVHTENLVHVNATEHDALAGLPTTLDAGNEFIDPHHAYSHDLDIFGDGSVYQLINRANTRDGRASLANLLNQPHASVTTINAYQQAVGELKDEVTLRQHLAATGLELNELAGDRAQLLAWLTSPTIAYGKRGISAMLWLLPLATLLAWALYFAGLIPAVAGTLCVFIQWTIWGRYSKRINVFHDYISRKKALLEKYGMMLAVIRDRVPDKVVNETADAGVAGLNRDNLSETIADKGISRTPFKSELLAEIERLAGDAGKKVDKLASLVYYLNARTNVMMVMLVNSFFLYDLRCVFNLEKWKAEHGSQLPAWLKAISDVEVLSGMANFAFNHPHCNFPSIHNEWAIRADDMGHPLIDPATCVTNSITIGPAPSVLIVTGANMAGKSTFLRSLGVNMVLSMAGAPVYATRFSCPVIPLRSGMRTADSLKDHESYFYAELNRLKSIMDELRSGKPIFILLDEILKGTNSTDKQRGSIALVKQLVAFPCLGVVATHDLALGSLSSEHPSSVRNYCFEATIEGDQLFFDYKLKPGLAQTMNATFLMKKMNII